MIKKSSSIIDLRNAQVKSGVKTLNQIPTNIAHKEASNLDNFSLPIINEGESNLVIDESNTIESFALDLSSFDLPLDNSYLDGMDIDIELIPKSAKSYNYPDSIKNSKFNIFNFFSFNKDAIYATRSSLGVFLSLCMILVMSVPSLRMVNQALVVKDNLLLQASASEKLLGSTNKDNFQQLSVSLNEIAMSLEKSSGDISSIQGNLEILLSILPGLSLIEDSSQLTSDISDVITISSELSDAITPFVSKDINPFDKTKSVTLVDGIKNIQEVNQKFIPALDKLNQSLGKMPISLVPGSRGALLRQVTGDIPKLKQAIIDSEKYVDIFLNFVGSDMLKRYVFIFQNNQELRATGGFIGSFGLMNIDKGVVKSLDIKEIYNPDGQLLKQILAPQPLQELTTRWYLRDSNWFADFPTSASKIISFYEKTGGATPDGVISLTPTVIERLLTITGPITLENYGVTVNSDNFVKVTQYQTGVAYDRVTNKPKQFIADLAPILINTLLSSDTSQYYKIIEALNNSFQEKHILLYFLNSKLQDTVEEYNLGGKLYDTPKDYLSVVHSNIGGYKTDGVMQDLLNLSTSIKDDGTITNKLIVTRAHKGGNTEYEWWNQDNINYMRIYIPRGAKVLNIKGYIDREEKTPPEGIASYDQDEEISAINKTLVHNEDWDIDTFEESGKFVIGGWVITKPGAISEVVVEYELPFTVKSGNIYSLILQKQSGTLGVKYQYNLDIPKKIRVSWDESSFDLEKTDSGYRVADGILRTDEYIGLQLK
ncbi:MAG: hypothetical protein RLZZ223_599 [Candidatus Parcubacteria bacterium]